MHPDLGSGVGSRGKILKIKQKLIYPILEKYKTGSVLDIGCGDFELYRNFNLTDYVGVDISSTVIKQCQKIRPDWKFISGNILELILEQADLVTCFDVVIHIPDKSDYDAFVRKMAGLAKQELIVAGYEENPEFRSEITFFHEPLSKTLSRIQPEEKIQFIGKYRDVSIFQLKKPR